MADISQRLRELKERLQGKASKSTPRRKETRDRLLKEMGFTDIEIAAVDSLDLAPAAEMVLMLALMKARGKEHTVMRAKAKAKAKRYPWWKDLGLDARPTTRDEARRAYSAALLKAHPDHGGDVKAMAKVRTAWERAQREFPGTE